jgi:hypothetical protein
MVSVVPVISSFTLPTIGIVFLTGVALAANLSADARALVFTVQRIALDLTHEEIGELAVKIAELDLEIDLR